MGPEDRREHREYTVSLSGRSTHVAVQAGGTPAHRHIRVTLTAATTESDLAQQFAQPFNTVGIGRPLVLTPP